MSEAWDFTSGRAKAGKVSARPPAGLHPSRAVEVRANVPRRISKMTAIVRNAGVLVWDMLYGMYDNVP
jgi:hypothetical protein